MLLSGRTSADLVLWCVAFLLILAGIGLVLWFERCRYKALGKPGSWMWMRFCSIPIMALAVLVVLVPARIISGPAALAYFYLALLTLAPNVWFGLHIIIRSIVKPSLTKSESTTMALMGLALLIVPMLVIGMLQGPIFMASRFLNERGFVNAGHAPFPLDIQPVQHFRLGDAGEIYTQNLLAPAGIHIERVDALFGDTWHDTKTMTHSYFCRQGEDLHITWSGIPPPPLKLFWRDGNGRRQQAEFRIDSPAAKEVPMKNFAVGWRVDGIDLPVLIHRDTVQLGWINGDKLFYRSLNQLQQGESLENECVAEGYKRVEWQREGPIAGMIMSFPSAKLGEYWQFEVKRQ